MSLVQTKERLRKARNELEPLVSGNKVLGRRINNVLNELAEIEAEYEHQRRDFKHGPGTN